MTAVAPRLLLPEVPAVVAGTRQAVVLTPDGELVTLDLSRAAARVRSAMPLVCHARATARRLGLSSLAAFDLLELFAFVLPARFCLPTPRGLAVALELPEPQDPAEQALTLVLAAQRLLALLVEPGRAQRSDPLSIAGAMAQGGWPWARFVLAVQGVNLESLPDDGRFRSAFQVWRKLPEWAADAPEPQPGQVTVEPNDARRRLAEMLVRSRTGVGDSAGGERVSEARPQQADYAGAVSLAFTPRRFSDSPNLVLAEAGTGVGKTLGYLASATLWAERNRGAVWISTFTRNLQHQIDGELDRLFPDPEIKAKRVVVRKGRENYLCLLNFEEVSRGWVMTPRLAPALGLMARWLAETRDGDLQGGDFPGWLIDLLGGQMTLALADRRGECIYSACDHYHRCFIERSVRRARRADIVIANHALVMIQAALGGDGEPWLPTRYVFDEGHHVFNAADGVFAGHLTARETTDLRRWLLGGESEGAGRNRARGLRRRLEDLIGDSGATAEALDEVLNAARCLTGEGWVARLAGDSPQGPTERFLALVRSQVMIRAHGQGSPYSLEVETINPIEGLIEAAEALEQALRRLATPIEALAAALAARLDDEAVDLETDQRRRIDAMSRGLRRRRERTLMQWLGMLQTLRVGAAPAGFVDWFGVERHDGREADLGYYRHHIDPTEPFAATLGAQAHGLVMTSATLTDGTGDPEKDWQAAEARSGAIHLPHPAIRAAVPSPFDYPAHTLVLIVNDVRKDETAQVAAAYRELFLAAQGGALGLFTAIERLRAVHARLVVPLDQAGLPLLAQHVDGLDVSTLIDIFRAEDAACLLGTDAVRDGIDVPGRSLRLIVFDRVPWPRPNLLHKARRAAFGGRRYDDMIARLRLKQAFGRLVRRADDRGVFVLLDPMMPSRLNGAFPEGVEPQRVGLAEAVRLTRDFLALPEA
ncbi:ATP-dependent DNA helicase DinG [uncultured Gammaproteobacteria bacterium]